MLKFAVAKKMNEPFKIPFALLACNVTSALPNANALFLWQLPVVKIFNRNAVARLTVLL